jgi:hypothetical protein
MDHPYAGPVTSKGEQRPARRADAARNRARVLQIAREQLAAGALIESDSCPSTSMRSGRGARAVERIAAVATGGETGFIATDLASLDGRTGLLIGPEASPVPGFPGSTGPRTVGNVLRLSREPAPVEDGR